MMSSSLPNCARLLRAARCPDRTAPKRPARIDCSSRSLAIIEQPTEPLTHGSAGRGTVGPSAQNLAKGGSTSGKGASCVGRVS
jgi:hypothetical protein